MLTSSAEGLAADNPFGYAGYMYDKEIGMYYLMARYYHPVHGVFISVDPDPGDVDDPITQNGYTYADNNPVKYIDPDGHSKTAPDDYGRAMAPGGGGGGGSSNAWKFRISLPSKPHTNKTPGHWFASLRRAIKEAKKDDSVTVYLNKGLQNIIPGLKPNRPDIMVVRKNGRVDQYEVPSKTDNVDKLVIRMKQNQNLLGKRGGKFELVPIQKRKKVR
ncbi:RHS repeat-associated core domain-containing protein [Ectobacillus sp. JY-23]|uniref:RHS repeat-associated core domain-containing protein n=1 Tax=Ectobacillus sp. JY-23 TaxID=2933872 RepID=UPI00248B9927|nr:RHS repeat-associated core domain-containing protein [Ectobacillus sp. JY-23]